MAVTLVLLVALIAYGILEFRRHQRAVLSIPIRVHVNGTRGKSSVTRLIAGGLRAGGIRTFGKTTGTLPRMILDDGREVAIRRVGKANIIEQVQVLGIAARRQSQAVVIECMALRPELQWLSEHRMVRATTGVITNAREDHFDVMGPTVAHVALSLCNTMPESGKLFTADDRSLGKFRAAAQQNKIEVVMARPDEVVDAEMLPFGYIEHKENVALALKVCVELGVPRETALQGMYRCTPDPGVLRRYRVRYFNKEIDFVNAFAANDRESTLMILERLGVRPGGEKAAIILFNTRGDRIQRAEQFAGMIARDIQADYFVLVGEFVDAVESAAIRLGAPPEKIVNLGRLQPAAVPELFERVLDMTRRESIVVGVGNIGGVGQAIVDFFIHRSQDGGAA